MKKIVIVSIIVSINLFGAVISGNQSKVSITGGSIDVSSGGSTVTVNSGEITSYGDGVAPSAARKVQKGDMNDIYSELSPTSDEDTVNLKFEPIPPRLAQKLRLELVAKGISRDKIEIKNVKNGAQIYIRAIELDSIKQIYGGHYKAGKTYFKTPSNQGKIPTITIKEEELRQYHRVLFSKSE